MERICRFFSESRDGLYSVAPRRRCLFNPVSWVRPVGLVSEAAERERVPCPNPRLAIEDTSRRIVSIGVMTSPMAGLDSPNNSHGILGFEEGRTVFLLGLPPLQPPDSFMCSPFSRHEDHTIGLSGSCLASRTQRLNFPSWFC